MEKDKINGPAPVVLFAYNRPWHLQQTLDALRANELAAESELFIFCDGPKPNASEEQLRRIEEVRAIARGQQWPKRLTVVESENNKGLGDSVIAGVSKIVTEYGRVIVVEDDVVTSPYFLRFMNDALRVYENESRVLSIGSWNYFTDRHSVPGNFFLQMPDTIAWATWARAWKLFEPDARKLHEQLKRRGLMKKFNQGNRFNFENMLLAHAAGKLSSWAIRWTAVAVLHDTLSLYPAKALSKHIGFGEDSTNCEGEDYNRNLQLADRPLEVKRLPPAESKAAFEGWMHIEKDIKRSGAVMDTRLLVKLRRLAGRVKRKLLAREKKSSGWFGNYPDWNAARAEASGYDDALITEKVRQSLLKVKRGEAAFERDSVAFETLDFDPNVRHWLNAIAAENGNELNVLDFGGSLGSTYFQYRQLLDTVTLRSWTVVEQPHFVAAGKKDFEDTVLTFVSAAEEAISRRKPDVLLLFSVLSYIEKPFALIEKLVAMDIPYILVDRTAVISAPGRITLQVVPGSVYKASYPAWFFNEKELVSAFTGKYVPAATFSSKFAAPYVLGDGVQAEWKGFVFKRR